MYVDVQYSTFSLMLLRSTITKRGVYLHVCKHLTNIYIFADRNESASDLPQQIQINTDGSFLTSKHGKRFGFA